MNFLFFPHPPQNVRAPEKVNKQSPSPVCPKNQHSSIFPYLPRIAFADTPVSFPVANNSSPSSLANDLYQPSLVFINFLLAACLLQLCCCFLQLCFLPILTQCSVVSDKLHSLSISTPFCGSLTCQVVCCFE